MLDCESPIVGKRFVARSVTRCGRALFRPFTDCDKPCSRRAMAKSRRTGARCAGVACFHQLAQENATWRAVSRTVGNRQAGRARMFREGP
jgi:hypothetical protein